MAESPDAHELVVWTDRAHERLIEATLAALGSGWRILGVAGPAASPPDRLATNAGLRCLDDLRSLVIDHPARVALISSSDTPTLDELDEATERCDVVVLTESLASDLASCTDHKKRLGPRLDRILYAPRFSECPGMLAATEPTSVLGEPRMVTCEICLARCETRLATGLFHAWQSVLESQEMPEEVSASLVGGQVEPANQIRGSLAIAGRLAGAGSSLIAVSDQTGRWERRMRMIGPDGSLEVTDDGYRLLDADGSIMDRAGEPESRRTQADLIAHQLARLVEGPGYGQGGSDSVERVTACCEATILSLRTGQSESPAKLLQLR
ncbi:hypothetical protein [Mucisphaera calidilacus]|uniref:Gfo/Idh/MocA-like oxidoreductase N-terminal domain-containing protein n=1 Tax=Mucisphaera calidilacus TaxID=2527982 RepID=A0A518BV54_9BACT|nr:hypothetical protein [Mucisphaera calidilacus]QDU70849.1 hypothetical protein Pan265_06880 [Mucisphaera calidilacus]